MKRVKVVNATVMTTTDTLTRIHTRMGPAIRHANGKLQVYLRPEDIVARPIEAGDANVFDAAIEKIEFLGPYCLVRVKAGGLPAPLTVYLSLNYLSECGFEVGSVVKLKILTDRLRLFDA